MWCTRRQHAEMRSGGLYVHCNSIVLILYFQVLKRLFCVGRFAKPKMNSFSLVEHNSKSKSYISSVNFSFGKRTENELQNSKHRILKPSQFNDLTNE